MYGFHYFMLTLFQRGPSLRGEGYIDCPSIGYIRLPFNHIQVNQFIDEFGHLSLGDKQSFTYFGNMQEMRWLINEIKAGRIDPGTL